MPSHLPYPPSIPVVPGHDCTKLRVASQRIQVDELTDHSPSLRSDSLAESPKLRSWIETYLGVGEVIMDQSVAIMSSSGYFERKR